MPLRMGYISTKRYNKYNIDVAANASQRAGDSQILNYLVAVIAAHSLGKFLTVSLHIALIQAQAL